MNTTLTHSTVIQPTISPTHAATIGASASTLILVACIALMGVLVNAFVQWRIGKRTIRINTQTAEGVARRAEAEARSKRYQDAAEHLGHDQAPVRLAGAYAMARLADEWPAERQTCVDVLCAYLRMAWKSVDRFDESEPPDPPETQVRQTIVDIIARHVRADAPRSWSDLTFDLTSAKLPSLCLEEASFEKPLTLDHAEFLSKVHIRSTTLKSGATFREAHFLDGVEIHRSELHQLVDFGDATFPIHSTSSLVLDWLPPDASVRFSGHVAGELIVALGATSIPQGQIVLGRLFGIGNHKPLRIIAQTMTPGSPKGSYHPTVLRNEQPDEYGMTIEVAPSIEVRET